MRFSAMLCATVGLLALSASAFAQATINYQIQSGAPSFYVTYLRADGTTRYNENVLAGPFTAHVVTTPAVPDFKVYCVDLENNTASPSQVNVNTVTVPLSNPGLHYDGTRGTYLDLAKASWLIDYFNVGLPSNLWAVNGDAVKGAALQAAIWDVIDGNTDFNVTTGDFKITSGDSNFSTIVTDANYYLSQLSAALAGNLQGQTGLDNGVLYQIDRSNPAYAKPNGQDMLGGSGSFKTNATPATPEGASLLMFLPGLIPVAVGLRRRRNKSVGK